MTTTATTTASRGTTAFPLNVAGVANKSAIIREIVGDDILAGRSVDNKRVLVDVQARVRQYPIGQRVTVTMSDIHTNVSYLRSQHANRNGNTVKNRPTPTTIERGRVLASRVPAGKGTGTTTINQLANDDGTIPPEEAFTARELLAANVLLTACGGCTQKARTLLAIVGQLVS